MNLLYHKCSVKSNNRHGEAGVFWCLFLVFIWCLFLQKQAKRNECSQSWNFKKSHDTAIYRTLQMCTKVVLENSSPVARTKKGWRNRCHPDFFQYSCGFPGFLGPIFQNRPTVDVQPPKEQKQQKAAFLLLLRKAVFSFFRHRQRNDFRLSVRAVLGFDRGRRQ